MATKLHRCGNRARFGPCWRVQKALDEQGIAYEVVPGPWRPKKRIAVIEGTGQPLYPAIEFGGRAPGWDAGLVVARRQTIRADSLCHDTPPGEKQGVSHQSCR